MTASSGICFIAIDDDNEFNMITEFTIKAMVPNAEVYTFPDPALGLNFIQNSFIGLEKEGVLFLDINMPILNGWGVLDKIGTFGQEIKDRLKIFVLSSSIDPDDKKRAENNPLVVGFVEKPIRKLKFRELLAMCYIEV